MAALSTCMTKLGQELVALEGAYKQYRDDVSSLIRAVCSTQERPSLHPSWPDGLNNLLTLCWSPDSETRPTFDNITKRLQCIRVQLLIPRDRLAVDFWKQHFLGRVNTCPNPFYCIQISPQDVVDWA